MLQALLLWLLVMVVVVFALVVALLWEHLSKRLSPGVKFESRLRPRSVVLAKRWWILALQTLAKSSSVVAR